MILRKKISFFLLILVLLPSIIITAYKSIQLNVKATTNPISQKIDQPSIGDQHKNQWMSWLNEQEKQIWDELTTTTKLTQEHCATLKKEWYAEYLIGEEELHKKESKPTPISKKTHDIINTIMGDFGISTKDLPLITWKDNSAAGTTDSKLLINERLFNKLTREAQKFVIGHEIQHYLHKDTSTRYVIERFYQPGKNLTQDHPINKLYRFQEIRADILSALKGPEYQQGYLSFIETIAKKGENEGITHPKNSLRLSMGTKLINNLPVA